MVTALFSFKIKVIYLIFNVLGKGRKKKFFCVYLVATFDEVSFLIPYLSYFVDLAGCEGVLLCS